MRKIGGKEHEGVSEYECSRINGGRGILLPVCRASAILWALVCVIGSHMVASSIGVSVRAPG